MSDSPDEESVDGKDFRGFLAEKYMKDLQDDQASDEEMDDDDLALGLYASDESDGEERRKHFKASQA